MKKPKKPKLPTKKYLKELEAEYLKHQEAVFLHFQGLNKSCWEGYQVLERLNQVRRLRDGK